MSDRRSRVARWLVLASGLGLCVLLAVSCRGSSRAASQRAEAGWPQGGGGPSRSGQIQEPGPAKGAVVWSWTPPAEEREGFSNRFICAGPLVGSDGTVYIVSGELGQTLHAVAPDGTPRWSVPISMQQGGRRDSGLALDSEGCPLVVVGDALLRIDPCGAVRDSIGGVAPGGALSLAADGTLYRAAGSSVTAVTPGGEIAWSRELGTREANGAAAIGPDGRIHVPLRAATRRAGEERPSGPRGALAALSPKGDVLWEVDLGGGCISCAVGRDGTVYAADGTGVSAITASGRVRWQCPAERAGALALAPDGTVIAAGRGILYAISAEGKAVWTRSFEGSASPGGMAVDREGNVYVRLATQVFSAAPDRKLRWVAEFADAAQEEPPWSSLPDDASGLAFAPGGRIYACSRTTLHAIEAP